MRSFLVVTALVVQLVISASALEIVKAPEPVRGPRPPTEDNPNGAVDSNGQYHGEAIGVPGALAKGQNPQPAKGDESTHFDDIAEALKTLVEKIVDAVDNSVGGSSSSGTARAATAHPSTTIKPDARIPSKATPCSIALGAFGGIQWHFHRRCRDGAGRLPLQRSRRFRLQRQHAELLQLRPGPDAVSELCQCYCQCHRGVHV